MIDLELPAGPLRVLCVAAHPDDIEIGCGGTLLTFAERGDVSAHWLTLTGSPDRVAEAEAAAQAFLPGASTTFHTFTDGRLPAAWNEVKDVLHAYAASMPSPDLVLAPRPDDAHQDHRLLGEMAPTVWRDATVWHYEIPKWDGDVGRPNAYVRVEPDAAHRKVALLNEHYRSQIERDWWDDEMFLGLMRIRGMECRSRYAEAYFINKMTLGAGSRQGVSSL